MPIVQLHHSIVDKLWLLWAVCLVAHYHETNKKLSPINIIEEFGDHIWQIWMVASDTAIQYKLLTHNLTLTPKGQTACNNWQAISAKIYQI